MTEQQHKTAGVILDEIDKISSNMKKYLSGSEKMDVKAALWYCNNYPQFIEPEVVALVSELVISSARRKIVQLKTRLQTL